MKTKTHLPSYESGLISLRSQLKEALPGDLLQIFDNDAAHLEKNLSEGVRLKKGDIAPDFELLNAAGEKVRLYEMLTHQRVVLVFYRGGWCPYCNLQLMLYQKVLPEFRAQGAVLVAVSPESPDNSMDTKEKNTLAFEVLSDPGNIVAKQYVEVFRNSERAIEAMASLGINFYDFYTDSSGTLPVPAVFIIEQSRRLSFARSGGGDYRSRVEPEDILNVLKSDGDGK
ncbi:peroxiredoxin-like family protein [Robertkochia flava]|uniref:peroxiredoxin-like family protein n=1 Tax=Robertkochia flava TaxID=3447986 RepID=UPI001CCA2B67|nr:peroxiredoxin-like family protein [Robertkochia marina]